MEEEVGRLRSNPGEAGTEECSFESCNNEVRNLKYQLCVGHYSQHARGKELTPLNPNFGKNSKYTKNSKCEFEGCENKPLCKGKCSTHYSQHRTYGTMWKIGEGRGAVTSNSRFSTERFCSQCQSTKDWRQYHLEQGMCTACYRKTLTREVDPLPGSGRNSKTRKPYTMTDMMDFLNTVSEK